MQRMLYIICWLVLAMISSHAQAAECPTGDHNTTDSTCTCRPGYEKNSAYFMGAEWWNCKKLDQDSPTEPVTSDESEVLGKKETRAGLDAMDDGQNNRAIEQFSSAISVNPNADNYLYRGIAWERKGEFERARTDYRTVLNRYLGNQSAPTFLKSLDDLLNNKNFCPGDPMSYIGISSGNSYGGSYNIANGCEAAILLILDTIDAQQKCERDTMYIGKSWTLKTISYFSTPPKVIVACYVGAPGCDVGSLLSSYGKVCN